MRILTFGWDYPPMRNGGLGVACHGLTEELIELGAEVIFVLPREQPTVKHASQTSKFLFACKTNPDGKAGTVSIRAVESSLLPYHHSDSYISMILPNGSRITISRKILDEVHRYAEAARTIAQQETFDVIHAHDWTAYAAGVAAKEVSGKPLVLHVHATSFDQAGGENVDSEIFAIERSAFNIADSVVAISNYTKNLLIRKYEVSPQKITVVHNGIKPKDVAQLPPALANLKAQGKKIVFYNGRITIQKGVDFFIRAARKVVDIDKNVVFVISGWGDMERQIMHLTGELGLSEHVIFAGALWDDERDRMYQAADLLVMPSVSEPFGLVPLEAIQQGTPVLISKQSGVAEVLQHALKVDFWDIDEMANKIVCALRYDVMNRQLVEEGKRELLHITWKRAAEKIIDLYHRVTDWFTRTK